MRSRQRREDERQVLGLRVRPQRPVFQPDQLSHRRQPAGPWLPWTKLETDPPSADSYQTQFGRLFEIHGRSGSFVMANGNRYWTTIPVAPLRPEDSAPRCATGRSLAAASMGGDVPFLRYYDTWFIDLAARALGRPTKRVRRAAVRALPERSSVE